jgi:hypothetical protein
MVARKVLRSKGVGLRTLLKAMGGPAVALAPLYKKFATAKCQVGDTALDKRVLRHLAAMSTVVCGRKLKVVSVRSLAVYRTQAGIAKFRHGDKARKASNTVKADYKKAEPCIRSVEVSNVPSGMSVKRVLSRRVGDKTLVDVVFG